MSLTRIDIYIPSPAISIVDYDVIQVWRASSKYGTYSEITALATRVAIVATQYNYEYDDTAGSEFYWYKWRYADTADAVHSEYFEPVQGYTPNATYCSLDSVKRHLRAKNFEGRINLSDIYKNLKQGRTQNVLLSEISINPEYSGVEQFTVTFLNATQFTVEVGEESSYEKRYLGQGAIGSDFVTNDNTIKINSADWSGVPIAGDTIVFETHSHMSTNDAIKFIQDAEILVDVILEENIGYLTTADQTLRFTRDNVPKAVMAATSRFAAFFIYTTIYNEQAITGLPNNINDITMSLLKRDDDLSSWSKQAMRYLSGFITKYTEFFDPESGDAIPTAPQWIAMDSLFDAKGVAYVGEGLKIPDKNVFFDRAEMTYDGLLDWDLLIEGRDQYDAGAL